MNNKGTPLLLNGLIDVGDTLDIGVSVDGTWQRRPASPPITELSPRFRLIRAR